MLHRHFTKILTGAAILAMTGCAMEADDENLVEASSQELNVADSYIVVLKPGVSARSRASKMASDHGLALGHVYENALNGFSFRGSATAAARLASNPDVAYIEPDGVMTIVGNPVEVQARPGGGGGGTSQVTPWGITRVGGFGDGTGKTAWIIDTGIDFSHADLIVDTARSANFARGSSADDGNGHGTHVAGTVAAINNSIDVVGVAAGATVVPVRVLDNSGSGTYSGVIAGVDHVAANGRSGDVANMSLGGGFSQSVNDAVKNAASTGVKFAVAAGNSGIDASNSSPASVNHTNVYTVSATASNDCLTSWSNYGNPPVDYAAPGASILSTKDGGGTTTLSGTSMASPHVAGLLLLGSIRTSGFACADPDGNPDPIASR